MLTEYQKKSILDYANLVARNRRKAAADNDTEAFSECLGILVGIKAVLSELGYVLIQHEKEARYINLVQMLEFKH